MLLNHAAGEGWTLQGWIFGALKEHGKNTTSWKVTPLSLRFVSACVEMRSIFIHFSSLKKMIESPSFQIGGVAWRMIISDVFNLLAFFERNHFHPIEIITFHPNASESSPITGPIIDQLEENLAPKTSQ